MLKLYDIAEGVNTQTDYKALTVKVLKHLYREREIPEKSEKKDALIYYLRIDEQVKRIHEHNENHSQQLRNSIDETEREIETMSNINK